MFVVHKSEISLLKMIYKDLAQRHIDDVITKECFSDFFNMIVNKTYINSLGTLGRISF